MPEAIATWIATNTLTASSVLTFTQIANLTYVALAVASISAGNYQRRKAQRKARDAFNESLQDRLVMTATVDGARSRVYGRVRTVDGVLFKATRGPNSEFYTLLVALAGHEIDAVEGVYLNDQLVTLDGSGYVQTAPWLQSPIKSSTATMTVTGGSGSVTLPYTPVADSVSVTLQLPNTGGQEALTPVVVGTSVSVSGSGAGTAYVTYQYEDTKSYARVRSYLGTAAQDLSADLVADFPDLCTTGDKFRGIALLRVDLEYSQDAFPTGVPNISALVRGAKIYDPRSGLTVWTQNPAVIARDWVRYAYGGNTTSISDTAVNAAANVCDVDTAFVTPSGTTTMDTYQAGIVCKLDQDPSAALSEMVEAMAGRWGWAGGTLRLVAGAYRAPVATITEDWITDASDITISPSPPRAELVNAYRPTISNRDNHYVIEPAPPLIASTYVTADGQQLDAEITMAAVTSTQHAQHIAGVLLRDARQSLTVSLPCNLRAWKLELFDTVNVTLSRFGWSSKLFEVVGWRSSLDRGVVLTLKEASAAVFNPDAGFADLGNDDNSDLPVPWLVPAVSGLAVTSGSAALSDGSIVMRTQVTWTAVADASVTQSGRIEVQYVEAGTAPAGDWPSQSEPGNSTQTTIVGLRAGYVYVFRVRAVNSLGVRSAWALQVAHRVPGAPVVGGANIVANSSFEVDSDANGRADSWFAYSAGSTGTVTYELSAISVHGTYRQTVSASALGATTGDRAGVGQIVVAPFITGERVQVSGWVASSTGTRAVVYGDWFTSGGVFLESAGIASVAGDNAWHRLAFTATVPATAARLAVYGWMDSGSGGGKVLGLDAFQVEIGDVLTGYAPMPPEALVTSDFHDFAGTAYGFHNTWTTRRTLTVTPAVDCTIEFSATLNAAGFYADSARGAAWVVTAGGVDTALGACSTDSNARQSFSCVRSFAASAGVTLDFKVQTRQGVSGGPSIYLYESAMRVTEVRR